jgi:hypothetical protein
MASSSKTAAPSASTTSRKGPPSTSTYVCSEGSQSFLENYHPDSDTAAILQDFTIARHELQKTKGERDALTERVGGLDRISKAFGL